MKTAVEWFNEQIKLNAEFREIFQGRVSFTIGLSKIDELLKQAKEIEKEQMESAYLAGESKDKQYYKETFKSE